MGSLSDDRGDEQRQAAACSEPCCLVEVRVAGEAQHGASAVPYTVLISGDHAELVVAWRKIGVVGRAARAGIHPIAVVAFQLVPELHSLGNQKAQTCVMEIDAVLIRRDTHALNRGHWLSIHIYFLYFYRRRQRVAHQSPRLPHHPTLL